MGKSAFEILLVEDSPTDRLIATEALARSSRPNKLNSVQDGVEALDYLRRRGAYENAVRPDLILLDLNLPRKSGREVLAELKADPQLRTIPVVVLTTSEAEEDIRNAYQHQANSYITKPVDFEQYSQALAAVGDYWSRLVTPPPAPVAPMAPPASDPFERPAQKRKVLLVEDSASDHLLFRLALQESSTAETELAWAQNLSGARDCLAQGEFDLIVADLGLPDSTGIETFRRLQKIGRGSPILVLTILEDELLGQTALREGAQDYLVKDQMTGRALGRAVAQAIQRAQHQARLQRSQQMEAIGQLAGGIAHDFNNLLTIIQGHGQVLSSGDAEPQEAAEAVGEILAATRRAAELTRQLLTFSGRQRLNRRVLDLNQVVGDWAKVLRRLLEEKITLSLQLTSAPMPVRADLGMLELLLTNLALNARDAMLEGGVLSLQLARVNLLDPGPSARKPGDWVQLTVSDTGCGIAPENLGRVFEPYYTSKDVGSGLGLATVQSIVEQHSGWLELTSAPGQGTQFRIYLAYQEAAVSSELADLSTAPSGRGEIILVVEDEAPLRRVTLRNLRRNGYQVLEAKDGHEALELLRDPGLRIDLLFTDLMMPGGLGGRELAVQARALRPELPVLYSSGYSPDLANPQFELEEGRNFLQKPYPFPKLLSSIRAVLEEGEGRSGSAASVPPE
ncbi:response regulator [bacterium]|nr:response regulator [bacterium]